MSVKLLYDYYNKLVISLMTKLVPFYAFTLSLKLPLKLFFQLSLQISLQLSALVLSIIPTAASPQMIPLRL